LVVKRSPNISFESIPPGGPVSTVPGRIYGRQPSRFSSQLKVRRSLAFRRDVAFEGIWFRSVPAIVRPLWERSRRFDENFRAA
jgi:hypothetical protein